MMEIILGILRFKNLLYRGFRRIANNTEKASGIKMSASKYRIYTNSVRPTKMIVDFL
jgi:hypothetical protein